MRRRQPRCATPPDFLPCDLMSVIGNMSYPTQSNYTGVDDHMTAPSETLTTMVTGETTQQATNCKSKAAGRGAGRLASTTARDVSQGSMGALVQAQPSWIEEREVEMRHDTGSAAPQQIVPQSAENAEDRSMLQTTQADEERGAVRHIKCKLCPTARFGQWETYKRHCKTCEKHPAELRFCPRCGDYFARPDSGKRHNRDKKHQEPEAMEKRQKVERLLREFEARLEYYRTPFLDIVNKKLTNTSKKISKHESTWSEGDSWAAGLR
ncbi:hypothetical protein EI94DRAFT_1718792 [Lactarius quietus]|nr:hypothetical protein EI94DRAFT_1718792 [Lactarius quietus]